MIPEVRKFPLGADAGRRAPPPSRSRCLLPPRSRGRDGVVQFTIMRGRPIRLVTALLLLTTFLARPPAAASPGEPAAAPAIRSLAIADPVVLGPDSGDAWFGAAVAELLRAKLQFLRKVRLLEREQLEPYLARLRDAVAEPDAEGDAGDRLTAVILPAEAFCVGSIEVDRRGGEPRLAVRLRLVQTATGMVLSRLTATATGDLPGLLTLAGQLAKELAAKLGETLDPDALAYQEPQRIDALKLHAEGLRMLARGEHREAVAALTAALDGNAGVYFPAAHRDLGAAYRLWARSLSGAEAEAVRQAYLARFKQDALLAAAAIFDLGVAYQENGLHAEAIETFTDYLAAVGEEGRRVRWSFAKDRLFETVAQLTGLHAVSNSGSIDWAGSEGDVLHLLVGDRTGPATWIKLDTRTGAPITALPVTRPHGGDTIRVSDGRLVFSAYDTIAVLSPEGSLAWQNKVGGNLEDGRTDAVEEGKIVRRSHGKVSVYSLGVGSLVAAFPEEHESPLFGLDLAGKRYSGSRGTWSLHGGAPAGPPPPAIRGNLFDWRDLPLPGIRHATGIPGFEWALAQDATPQRPATVLLREGGGAQPLGIGCFPAGQAWRAALPGGRHLLFSCGEETPHGKMRGDNSHYLLVDTGDGATRTLFKGVGRLPSLATASADHLVFSFRMNYPREDPVLRGEQGLVPGDQTGAFAVVETANGRVVGRERTVREVPLHAVVLDGDLVLATGKRVTRLRLPPRGAAAPIPAGEAHLRIAGSLIERGDLAAAQRSIEFFAAETPGDPRELLALMRLEVARGRAPEASHRALTALRSPLLTDREIRSCLEVLRRTNPEYRDFIRLPAGVGQLRLRGMTDEGVIVAQGGEVWHLIDTARGGVRSAASPFGKDGTLRLDQGTPALFRFTTMPVKWPDGWDRETDPWRYDRFDLASRKVTEGVPVPGQAKDLYKTLYHRPLESAGIPPSVVIENPRLPPESVKPNQIPLTRDPWIRRNSNLVVIDPQTLAESHRVYLPEGDRPIALSRKHAVLGEPFAMAGAAGVRPTLVVLRRSDGVEVARVDVPLREEMIFAVAIDESTLFVAVAGGDTEAFLAGTGPWFRIEAIPIDPQGWRWSYRTEGYLASNPVLEKGRLSFAAVPGQLPRPDTGPDGTSFAGFPAPLKLSLLRLDARSGALLGTEPLRVQSKSLYGKDLHIPAWTMEPSDPRWLILGRGGIGRYTDPTAPRVLFPGSEESVWGDPSLVLEYFFPAAGVQPLELVPGSLARKIHLDTRGRCIVRGDTVYEAFGQGLILVKDFRDGAWMASFAPE